VFTREMRGSLSEAMGREAPEQAELLTLDHAFTASERE
jgi:hypothetical protein